MIFNRIDMQRSIFSNCHSVLHWHIVVANASWSHLKANLSFENLFPIMLAQLKTVLLIKEGKKYRVECL